MSLFSHVRKALAGLLVMAASLTAVCAQAQGRPMLLAGNENIAYLTLPEGESQFQVLSRLPGEPWKRLTEEPLNGTPVLTVVVGDELHVFFPPLLHGTIKEGQPQMEMQVDPSIRGTTKPSGPTWPSGKLPLAACEAKGFAGVQSATVLAVVALPAGSAAGAASAPATGATTTTTTATATRPVTEMRPAPSEATTTKATTAGVTEPVDLGLFQRVEGQWVFRGTLGHADLPRQSKAFMTVVDGTVYLLVAAQGGSRLLSASYSGRPQDITLPKALGEAQAVGMVGIDKMVLILTTAAPTAATAPAESPAATQAATGPALTGLTLWVYEGGEFTATAVRSQHGPSFGGKTLPQVARCGDYIELLWTADGKTMAARLDVNAVLGEAAEIDVLTQWQPRLGEDIYRKYYMVGVMLLALLLVLASKPTGPPKPFSLPPTLQVAKLGRRALALLIDVAPLLWGSMAIWGWEESVEGLESLRGMRGEGTNTFFFALMTGLTVLLVYGFVTELLMGATIGKRLMGIRVVGDEGAKPTWQAILLRNAVKLLELFWLMLPLAIIFPLITRYRQRLGDIFARTAVVDKKDLPLPPSAPSVKEPTDGSSQ